MSPKPAKQPEVDQPLAPSDVASSPAWARNGKLAEHFTVSAMCIWRWKRNAQLKCPPSYVVNGIEWNDLNAWDRWMRDRMISHTGMDMKKKNTAGA